MKYKLFIQTNTQFGWKYFRVKFDEEKYSTLENILFSDNWSSNNVQDIINGIQAVKESGSRYEWANEDIHLVALPEGVFFFNLLARRAGEKRSGQDLELSHDEFIQFLEDFKKFIEANS